jgi:uroporphyrin-III C-methyltransferase/precorrin-2 dehydrogenase/sirohydrochlorin ferrochelatase
LTLKALRALQSADVILYDDLVAPAIVEMARREAEKIPVGKRGYKPSCRQDHIVSQLVALASQGKRVVRLKGGDPMIFGRANEEIAALRAAGIPVEVVPGVTAALGAAAMLQVSLTEREKARRLQFITAHAHDGKLPVDMDWRALCDPRASTVV